MAKRVNMSCYLFGWEYENWKQLKEQFLKGQFTKLELLTL